MKNYKNIIIGLLLVLVIIFGLYGFLGDKKADPNDTDQVVTNFKECMDAGNIVQEKYPRVCVDKEGNNFEEYVGNVLEKQNLIILESPLPNSTIKNPLVVKGKARGYWFFEASFPIVVTNWDGLIIGEGFATADGEWMTEEFVPFTATINYTLDPQSYSKNGTLILMKDNPSGLPENDDALEIPIVFE